MYYREICHYHLLSYRYTHHSCSSFHLNHRYKTCAVETASFNNLKINHDKEVKAATVPKYLAMNAHIISRDEASRILGVAVG
jgi:hypothetical protein